MDDECSAWKVHLQTVYERKRNANSTASLPEIEQVKTKRRSPSSPKRHLDEFDSDREELFVLDNPVVVVVCLGHDLQHVLR